MVTLIVPMHVASWPGAVQNVSRTPLTSLVCFECERAAQWASGATFGCWDTSALTVFPGVCAAVATAAVACGVSRPTAGMAPITPNKRDTFLPKVCLTFVRRVSFWRQLAAAPASIFFHSVAITEFVENHEWAHLPPLPEIFDHQYSHKNRCGKFFAR